MSANQSRVEAAVTRAEVWLWSMQADNQTKGVFRLSAHHNPATWPGVLLPGTYNAICCLALCGGLQKLSTKERHHIAHFLLQHQQENGVIRIPQMDDADVFKTDNPQETWRYIDFHISNYTFGALEFLGTADPMRLEFVRPFCNSQFLAAWLAARDMSKPWLEGNNIVNLASFLLILRNQGPVEDAARAAAAIDQMLDWHDETQDPATGFWGGHITSALDHLHAMAGATHNLHLYYAAGRPVPRAETMVDYCLSLSPDYSTACLDVDPADILATMHTLIDYRRPDINTWLTEKLEAVLSHQNNDGGFADDIDGTLRLDGWVNGYAEPQGISNTFATWFRTLTIAHISRALWPEWRRWGFRQMIGIGYALPEGK